MIYKKRLYRRKTFNKDLVSFELGYFESNLLISAQTDLSEIGIKYLRSIHSQVSDYCRSHPEFEKSLLPIRTEKGAPEIIRIMQRASKLAAVGPMATVAGAIAEALGKELLKYSREIIVENGGDIFISVSTPRKIGIFAGIGNIYNHLAMTITPDQSPCGICASSGKFGHSLSLGQTCATIIISRSAALADGYATAFGNMVNSDQDIANTLKAARAKKMISGIIIITNSKMAAYGNFRFDVLDK